MLRPEALGLEIFIHRVFLEQFADGGVVEARSDGLVRIGKRQGGDGQDSRAIGERVGINFVQSIGLLVMRLVVLGVFHFEIQCGNSLQEERAVIGIEFHFVQRNFARAQTAEQALT